MCDECTWRHKTFPVQSVYCHLAIKLYCIDCIVYCIVYCIALYVSLEWRARAEQLARCCLLIEQLEHEPGHCYCRIRIHVTTGVNSSFHLALPQRVMRYSLCSTVVSVRTLRVNRSRVTHSSVTGIFTIASRSKHTSGGEKEG